MTIADEEHLENRFSRMEQRQDDLQKEQSDTRVELAEMRADLRWIKWLLMVAMPAILLQLALAIIQLAK